LFNIQGHMVQVLEEEGELAGPTLDLRQRAEKHYVIAEPRDLDTQR
jgi:hypothetical protein